MFFSFAKMCRTIAVFHASFPLHHRPKKEASILARGLGFSVANVDAVSMLCCVYVFLALSPMLPSLTVPTPPQASSGALGPQGWDTTGPDLAGL